MTPHLLPVPWSRKSRAILLLHLWTVQALQNLSACTRVHFNFSFNMDLVCRHTTFITANPIAATCFGCCSRYWTSYNKRRMSKAYVPITACFTCAKGISKLKFTINIENAIASYKVLLNKKPLIPPFFYRCICRRGNFCHQHLTLSQLFRICRVALPLF